MSSRHGGTRTDQPSSLSAGPVPVGWQRKVEEGSVCYISPSGTALTSLEQTCAYLLADGTCKCGLECPLDMHKVFNFDPGAVVATRGAPGAQGQQDMTKLCNHRRKTVAMATLYRSIEGPPGPCCPGTGPGLTLLFSAEGHPATAPSTGTPLPSAVGSFPRVPLGTKTPEVTSAPTGTWLIAPPFLQPHNIVPGANGIPESCSSASSCFGLPLPLPNVVTPPRCPAARSQHPTGRTGESSEPGGLEPSLSATTSVPQAGEVDSPVSGALTNPSSNNLPVPLDTVPEGGGFSGLLPVSIPFSASSLLSPAAKAQLGSPHPALSPSTLPPCPLPHTVMRSLLGEQTLGRGAQWRPGPQDPAAPRVSPEPKGTPPAVSGQPLAALLSLLGAQGCPGEGDPAGSSLPLGPPPATGGSPCPGTGLLPPGQDITGQLLGLFGQLAASSEPTSGTSLQSRASGPTSDPGAAASPGVPKGAVAPGTGSNGERSAGRVPGCPLPPASKPVALGQEQALTLGASLPPGLLAMLPFSLALGQHPPACGGDPEGPSLPSLLAASLLPLPLGIPLPALDLLPSPGTLLSALLPLPPGPGERSPEGCPMLPDRAPLFSVLPALLALHPTLPAAGLGPSEPAPTTHPQSSLASPSVAPTSTGALPTTTEPLCEEVRAPESPTGALEPRDLLGCPLGSSLLSTTLLGNVPVLSPLLQNQPLLPPLGLSLGPGSPLGTTGHLASLLQSLQLGPRFGYPEKSATRLGPSAGGSPSAPAPPGLPEGTPSALEPPVLCPAELGSLRPSGGAQECPTSQSPLKRGRRRAEGLNREMQSLCGPPSTKSPRRGAGRGGWGTRRHFNGQASDRSGKGLTPAPSLAPHSVWHCKGDIPATGQQLRVEEIKHPPDQRLPGDSAAEGAQRQPWGWPYRGPGCGSVAWTPRQEPPEEAADVTVLGWGHPQHQPMDWGGGHSSLTPHCCRPQSLPAVGTSRLSGSTPGSVWWGLNWSGGLIQAQGPLPR
ncbi:methyl-CpG-binding domain protein 6 [Numenius arquata]|uniref:methyl-CpG-binding domain protein 6 n=1 Tax=Numenius arquata TaxID=31919 RepID=UPI003D30A767